VKRKGVRNLLILKKKKKTTNQPTKQTNKQKKKQMKAAVNMIPSQARRRTQHCHPGCSDFRVMKETLVNEFGNFYLRRITQVSQYVTV
jgi:cell division protein FtsB